MDRHTAGKRTLHNVPWEPQPWREAKMEAVTSALSRYHLTSPGRSTSQQKKKKNFKRKSSRPFFYFFFPFHQFLSSNQKLNEKYFFSFFSPAVGSSSSRCICLSISRFYPIYFWSPSPFRWDDEVEREGGHLFTMNFFFSWFFIPILPALASTVATRRKMSGTFSAPTRRHLRARVNGSRTRRVRRVRMSFFEKSLH